MVHLRTDFRLASVAFQEVEGAHQIPELAPERSHFLILQIDFFLFLAHQFLEGVAVETCGQQAVGKVVDDLQFAL